MKEFFKDILQDKTITSAFFINIFLIISAIAYILFSYGKLPPFIPVFNQLPWGEQRLGSQFTIFIPILSALLIFVINIVIWPPSLCSPQGSWLKMGMNGGSFP